MPSHMHKKRKKKLSIFINSEILQHLFNTPQKINPTLRWGLAEAVGFVETKFRNSSASMLAYGSNASAARSGFVAMILPNTTELCHSTAKINPTLRWGLAEAVGFEPTVPKRAQLISSQSRYDHFDTLPLFIIIFFLTRNVFLFRDCPVMSDCGVFVHFVESHLVQLWLQTIHWIVCFTRRNHLIRFLINRIYFTTYSKFLQAKNPLG